MLATQFAVAESQTRSPTTSPLIHLHHTRSTLYMLLSHGRRGCESRRRFRVVEEALFVCYSAAMKEVVEVREGCCLHHRRSTFRMLLNHDGGGCRGRRMLLPRREVRSQD
ncbi:hypothetical protein Adt_36843 [Abeliophyllum distichum]|uniref:Uncharacterized protein n=1 Tax=Abeliophyllum distichum TaxID=126358 RepID=A0ABD1QJZ9_9LAMI